LDFVVAFFGVLYAGAVAVPLVADQALAAGRVLTGDHHRLQHGRLRHQGRLDLVVRQRDEEARVYGELQRTNSSPRTTSQERAPLS
jgi:acyl-CoA synthetase (AMP-forming)/AMP-acid ligase II